MNGPGHPPLQPFFLDAHPGRRFCVFYPAIGTCRGSVLYVHPFAEEMNKSRRMAALQARALAASGISVLTLDCYGCGDSSGDFREARWDIWKADIAAGVAWLRQRTAAPISMWGLRLGALLMLDVANSSDQPFERLVLWQPVLSGRTFLTQFLRLRLASDMLNGTGEKPSVQGLRERLAAGETLEIAGYELASPLATALDGLELADLGLPGTPHEWLEIGDGPQTPATTQVIEAWTKRGILVRNQRLQGEPFWQTQEITECPELIVRTTEGFTHGL